MALLPGLAEASGSGPIGYWNLDEGTGTAAADTSGAGNNGTLVTGPVWIAGKLANALSFNGGTGSVSVNGAGSLANLYTSGLTVSAWIKPNSLGASGAGRVVEKNMWGLKLADTNKLWFGGNFATGTVSRESAAALTFGSWVHVAVTWTGSTASSNVHVYINGVLSDGITTEGAGAASSDAAYNLVIGNSAYTTARGFDGVIDEVRVYNRVLSAAEIQAIADTTAPANPTGLTATPISSSQINLSWTAATDNIAVTSYRLERCAGASCTTFAQIATPTTTTYSDTGLSAATSYSYRVRAVDAAANLSAYSSTATTSTSGGGGDSTPPTAPTASAASVVSSSAINLSWTASTDNVGVTGYRVERCVGASCTTFAQIATPTTTTYGDTGLSAATSYSYRLRATDAAGNLSAYSVTVTGTTNSAADTTPPTQPTGLSATAVSGAQVNLSWTASTDNVGVTSYSIERCQGAGCTNFAAVGTSASSSYSDTSVSASTTYVYRVNARDVAGNISSYSTSASVSTPYAPTAPTALSASPVSTSQINLSWSASTD
jgi:fibronectin type 3 domain-containing protein